MAEPSVTYMQLKQNCMAITAVATAEAVSLLHDAC